jgi:hypothetical protein
MVVETRLVPTAIAYAGSDAPTFFVIKVVA